MVVLYYRKSLSMFEDQHIDWWTSAWGDIQGVDFDADSYWIVPGTIDPEDD